MVRPTLTVVSKPLVPRAPSAPATPAARVHSAPAVRPPAARTAAPRSAIAPPAAARPTLPVSDAPRRPAPRPPVLRQPATSRYQDQHAPARPHAPRARPVKQPAEGIRLSKRVAELAGCSRADAEHYIEGGWVRVNGVVVELPGHRVDQDKVELDSQATLLPLPAITIVLHKPPDYDAAQDVGQRPVGQLLTTAHHAKTDKSGVRMLKQHFVDLLGVTPLETGASGLLVFTKNAAVQRKLVEDAARVEHEVIVDVRGEVTERALNYLNKSQVVDGRAMLPAKVSVTHQSEEQNDPVTGLRFAIKGCHPGQIKQMCEHVGLQVVGMKRIRVGRVMLAQLPQGQWRYLAVGEKF